MDQALLARLALTRLRLPVPTAKIHIVHGAATALRSDATAKVVWDELLGWIADLDLESEILEALTICLIGQPTAIASAEPLRAAIRWPSILSDVFVNEAFGGRVLVNSWAKSHSGEVPMLFRSTEIESELAKGRIVPPILRNRLRKLERLSGRPFLKQWVFEFERLVARVGKQTDGRWEYFIGEDDRQRASGQFVTRRGHLARSAYLRVLALACDQWDMPEEDAISEAMYATPVDRSFIRMPPGAPPVWAQLAHHAGPRSAAEMESLLRDISGAVSAESSGRVLLHLNVPLRGDSKFQGDVELISVLCVGEAPAPEDVFKMHDWLPGHVQIPRNADWNFEIPSQKQDGLSMAESDGLIPALLPAVAPFVGYFHSDLVSRMPYLPANYLDSAVLRVVPQQGGAKCWLDGRDIGEFHYWNREWGPTHQKELGTKCGIALTLNVESAAEILQTSKIRLDQIWRSTILSRESDFGEWTETHLYGRL